MAGTEPESIAWALGATAPMRSTTETTGPPAITGSAAAAGAIRGPSRVGGRCTCPGVAMVTAAVRAQSGRRGAWIGNAVWADASGTTRTASTNRINSANRAAGSRHATAHRTDTVDTEHHRAPAVGHHRAHPTRRRPRHRTVVIGTRRRERPQPQTAEIHTCELDRERAGHLLDQRGWSYVLRCSPLGH